MKLYLLLLLGLVLIPLSVWAQDPGFPDTVYFEAGGLHSADGETLYVSPPTLPADVEVNVMIWTDNGVSGVSLPLADTCYNVISMPTFLDPNKNDPDSTAAHAYVGTLIETFSLIGLNLYGTLTPSPPNFLIVAVDFTDSFYTPGKLAHLTFTVNDTGCLCLDTIPVFWPGELTPSLTTPNALSYIPIIISKCFTVDVSYLTDTLFVAACSPVDLIIIDPIDDSIGIDFNTIPDATYDTTQDLNEDGDLDDLITIPNRLTGDYSILVVAEPGDSGAYDLGVRIDGSDWNYLAQDQASPPPDEPDTFTYDVLWYLPGDPTGDWKINLSDVIYLANYLLKGGPAPEPLESGDVNCNTIINLSDVIYLANYLLKGGPPPCS